MKESIHRPIDSSNQPKGKNYNFIEPMDRFRRVFEQSSDPIFIYSSRRIEDVNYQACQLTGYSKDKLLTMSILDLHFEEDKEETRELLRKDFRTDSIQHQKIYRRADNRRIEVNINSYSLDPVKGTRVAIIRDITAEKAEETAIKASEERFRSLFELSNDAIIIHHRGQVRDANQKACEMMGYNLNQLLNMSVPDFHSEEERNNVKNHIEKMGNEPSFLETQWWRVDGKPIDVELSSSIIDKEKHLRQIVARDITEKKQKQRELLKEKALLERLFDNPHIAISIVDADHRFRRINRTFTKMFGYRPEEVIGRPIRDILAPQDDAYIFDERVARVVKGDRVGFEAKRQRKDGTMIDVLVAIYTIFADKELVGTYGLYQDISEIKEVERRHNALINELEVKNAELERFTYTVSHDLKSPLITIKAFLDFVEKDAISGNIERMREDIRRIENAAIKMEQLLSELLKLSRIGRIINAPEQTSFEDIVNEAIASVSGQIKKGRVQVIIHEGLPSILGDRVRLREVMENLLDNAVKFMGNQTKPQIHIESRLDGNETVFIVRDNGLGIKQEYQKRIFRLFERLDHSIEGTGVGLSLVKRIIEVHGGRIWIESSGKGHGTAVCFTLPLK